MPDSAKLSASVSLVDARQVQIVEPTGNCSRAAAAWSFANMLCQGDLGMFVHGHELLSKPRFERRRLLQRDSAPVAQEGYREICALSSGTLWSSSKCCLRLIIATSMLAAARGLDLLRCAVEVSVQKCKTIRLCGFVSRL